MISFNELVLVIQFIKAEGVPMDEASDRIPDHLGYFEAMPDDETVSEAIKEVY